MNTLTGGKSRKIIALFCMVMLLAAMTVGSMACAFAEEATSAGAGLEAIEEPITNGLSKVFETARVIATAIAIVVAAFTGIKMLLGDARAMETGKSTIFRIVAALAIIWLAPLLVQTIMGLFKDKGGDFSTIVASAK